MLVIENCTDLSDLRQKLIDGEEVRTAGDVEILTREEKQKAIDALKISVPVRVMTQEEFNDYIKTLNKIMDWLEQEPCEDAITRILKRMWNCRGKHTTSIDKVKMEQIIRDALPSVTPQPKQESSEDAIRREDALQALCKAAHKNDDTIPCPHQRESCLWSKTKVQDYAREIWKLPPVTPQPKTGHWIYKQYGGYPEQGDWYCSKCDYKFNFGHGYAEYCPKCGCEMSEAPTEEAISEYDT